MYFECFSSASEVLQVSRATFTQRNVPGHHDNEDRPFWGMKAYKPGDYTASAPPDARDDAFELTFATCGCISSL